MKNVLWNLQFAFMFFLGSMVFKYPIKIKNYRLTFKTIDCRKQLVSVAIARPYPRSTWALEVSSIVASSNIKHNFVCGNLIFCIKSFFIEV